MKIKRVLGLILAMFMIVVQNAFVLAEDAASFTIVSSSIEDGDTEVSPINLQLDVTFSDAVDTSTIKMSNVSATDGIFAQVVSTGEKSARIYFDRNKVKLGTKYTVTLKPGIKSVDGVPLETTNISFKTTKEVPPYRQVTNQEMDDSNNIYGLDSEAWTAVSIIPVDGNNVLQFGANWDEASVRQYMFCKAGRTYTARARVQVLDKTEVWLSLTYKAPDGSERYFGSERKTLSPGSWNELEYSWTIEDDADLNTVKQWIQVGTSGSRVYIDDWYFFENGHDENPPTAVGVTKSSLTTVRTDNDSLEKMKAFGVISKSAASGANVSRIEFAKIILNILGIESDLKGAATFKDVPESDMGAVSMIANSGLMSGYDDYTFGPDDNVTVEQALKVILNIMGQSGLAEISGGYPDGYYLTASNIGLLKKTDCGKNQALNYKNLAIMLDNALKEKVLTKANTKTEEGKTFLEYYFGYAEGEGIIEGTPETYLYSGENLNKNQVCINGTVFQCDKDISQYLGCKVRYYYDLNSDDDQLVYIYDIDNRNKIVEFSTVSQDVSFENNTYTVYESNGRKTNYRVENTNSVIYNGKYYADYVNASDVFVPKYGYIKLIDNGEGYKTVVITDIRTVHVGSIDYQKGIIYDRLGGKEINLSDCDVVSIKDVDGTDCELMDIKAYDLLSVESSKDGSIVKLHVSTNSVSGSVCEILKDEYQNEISIADNKYGSNVRTKYKTINGFFDDQPISMGETGTFYIDFLGNIGAFKTGESTKNVGYLVNAYPPEPDDDKNIYLRIFNTDGKMVKLKTADKLCIDQAVPKTSASALNMLKNGTDSVVSQLITYDIDVNGEVSSIDTAYNKRPNCEDYRTVVPDNNESEESLRVIYSSILPPNSSSEPEMLSFRPNARNFGGKVQLTDNAKIMYVPLNGKDREESDFYISDAVWDLGDLGQEMIEAYQTKGSSLSVDTVIVYIPDDRYWSSHLGEYRAGIVSEKKFEIINNEGCLVLYMLDGRKIHSEKNDWGSSIDVGDYIKYRVDKNDRLLEKPMTAIDVSEHSMPGSNPTGMFGEWDRAFYAKVVDKEGSELKIIPFDCDVTTSNIQLYSEVLNASKATVYLCDVNRENAVIEKASLREIVDYKNSWDCSEVIVVYQGDIAQYILVVK
ncbi:MAG: S-layer homology domain-containing protein [Clostridiales bacterium]|nr:S-layer homology domain-containing protein [Clostridiales bacterium]